MRFVLLEDDPLQSQWIKAELTREFENATVVVLETEEAFIAALPSILSEKPFVLLDVMVRWTNPKPQMPPPPLDVQEGGPFRAGLRCLRRLRRGGDDVKALLYTILERTDLQSEIRKLQDEGIEVIHVRKESSVAKLVEEIRRDRRLVAKS